MSRFHMHIICFTMLLIHRKENKYNSAFSKQKQGETWRNYALPVHCWRNGQKGLKKALYLD